MISHRARGSGVGGNLYRFAIKQYIQAGIGGIYVASQQRLAAMNMVFTIHCRISWYLEYQNKVYNPVR